MNVLGQIKKLWTHRALYMYSTKDLRSLPKPRSLFEMRSNQSVAFLEGAIKGEGKRGVPKGKWNASTHHFPNKTDKVNCQYVTNTSRGRSSPWANLLFIKLFIKWYHNQVKRSILPLYIAQQTRQMKWTKLFGPTSSNSQIASWLA